MERGIECPPVELRVKGAGSESLQEVGERARLPPTAGGETLRESGTVVPLLTSAAPAPGMHENGRNSRGGPRSGQTGGWRRLSKRLGAVTVGYKSWHLASERQWLGIGWALWRGGAPAPPKCIPDPWRPSHAPRQEGGGPWGA